VSAAQCNGDAQTWATFLGDAGISMHYRNVRDAHVLFRRACRLAKGANAASQSTEQSTPAWGTSVLLVLTQERRDNMSDSLVFLYDGAAAGGAQTRSLQERVAGVCDTWLSPSRVPLSQQCCQGVGAPITLMLSAAECLEWAARIKGDLLQARVHPQSADDLILALHPSQQTFEERAQNGGRSESTVSPDKSQQSQSDSQGTPQSRQTSTPQHTPLSSRSSPPLTPDSLSRPHATTPREPYVGDAMELCDRLPAAPDDHVRSNLFPEPDLTTHCEGAVSMHID